MDRRCMWSIHGRRASVLAVLVVAALLPKVLAGDSGEAPVAAANSRQLEADGRDRAGEGRSSVLVDIAREMVMRSATSSQVLSLNLTNLLILLILKALLFGAGIFSFGFLKQGGGYGPPGPGAGYPAGVHGRSSAAGEPTSASVALDEPEVLLLLSFLMGDAERQYDCLYRVACEQPKKAREYALAARALIKGANMLDSVIPYDARYETIVAEMQKAADFGLGSNQCSQRYTCDSAGRGSSAGDGKPAD